jgi:GntR family transcriptional regulator
MAGRRAGRSATAKPLDRRSPMPLWAQLHADVSRRLEAGAFDEAFPGELALAEEYTVSRQTVRAAVQRLRADGVVVAGRGRRPRVADRTPITQPLGTLYSLFASVEAAGLQQTSIVRARDTRTDDVAARRLGLKSTAPLFYLERLRLAGDQPLALDQVWLPADLAAPLMRSDFTHTALYDELAAHTGTRPEDGHEHIRAIVPTSAQRRLLGITAMTGALAIDRLGLASGGPVEYRHTVIRGDRFTLLATFSARTGYTVAHHFADRGAAPGARPHQA